mgnify:CR=1 FL=1
MFDARSASSILEFAKKLKNKKLREVCSKLIEQHTYKGKGNFGQLLEKYYFGYEPNSAASPDFEEAGIELKSSPLKKLKNGTYRSKERLVLNIINYLEAHKETFNKSSFWKKNAHLLLIFYLYEKESDILDYEIKLVAEWQYPEEDLKVMAHDWEVINQKIKSGKAHELSEGDTFYLGACTKGSTAAKSLRSQPFSTELAKQRAYCLKQGYVNHIIAQISESEEDIYGKIIEQPSILVTGNSLQEIVLAKFEPFYEKSVEEITEYFRLDLNKNAKNYFASITNSILGVQLGKRIAEFEKADIIVKTVRLKENNLPKEDISFPNFKYEEIVDTDWDNSDFKHILESKFFFVFYQFKGQKLVLKKVRFWNMPYADILKAKLVWDDTVACLKEGRIVKEVLANGKRKSYFPNKSNYKVSHVRPHAKNNADTYPLPVADKLTGLMVYTKHCFWLNAGYVRDAIYLI